MTGACRYMVYDPCQAAQDGQQQPLTPLSVHRAPQDEPRGRAAVLDAGHLAVRAAGSRDLPNAAALPVPGGGTHLARGPAHAQLLVSALPALPSPAGCVPAPGDGLETLSAVPASYADGKPTWRPVQASRPGLEIGPGFPVVLPRAGQGLSRPGLEIGPGFPVVLPRAGRGLREAGDHRSQESDRASCHSRGRGQLRAGRLGWGHGVGVAEDVLSHTFSFYSRLQG